MTFSEIKRPESGKSETLLQFLERKEKKQGPHVCCLKEKRDGRVVWGLHTNNKVNLLHDKESPGR